MKSNEYFPERRPKYVFFKYCLICDKKFHPTKCQKVCDKCKKKAGSKPKTNPRTKLLNAKP